MLQLHLNELSLEQRVSFLEERNDELKRRIDNLEYNVAMIAKNTDLTEKVAIQGLASHINYFGGFNEMYTH